MKDDYKDVWDFPNVLRQIGQSIGGGLSLFPELLRAMAFAEVC